MADYAHKGRFTGRRETGTDYSVLFIGSNDFVEKGTVWDRDAEAFREGREFRAFKDLTDFHAFSFDARDGASHLSLFAFLDSDDATIGTVFIAETHTEEFEFLGCDCSCSCCCECCTNADTQCHCGCSCEIIPTTA
ncbi:hypothetical protein [Streptomyces marianii]|uniref:Uncharacterized protein n=1 Tax=Streptomyces marianii TaxID=1817406 RepID=A0A5R9DRH5_9ACTN|nr:hypothetical protein [Streptomyces marianii]TLQ39180.1 hypothetical protein FEF34_37905 [Streptomyces marianii]